MDESPKNPHALLRRVERFHDEGLAYLDRGHFSNALVAFESELRVAHYLRQCVPTNLSKENLVIRAGAATAHLNRGMALEGLGASREAPVAYNAAITEMEALRRVLGETGWKTIPKLTTTLAGGYLNLGNALTQLGAYTEALKAYGRSIDAIDALHIDSRFRERSLYADQRTVLAKSHLNRGLALLKRGRNSEALQACRAAITEMQVLRDEMGEEEWKVKYKSRKDLASTYMNYSNILGDVGLFAEAVQACKLSISEMEALRGDLGEVEWKASHELRNGHAAGYGTLGNALQKLWRHGEALRAYDEAIRERLALREHLEPEEWKANPNLRSALGRAYANRGHALHHIGAHLEALESHEMAMGEIKVLQTDYPRATLLWEPLLTNARTGRATALFQLGRFADCEDELWRAVGESSHKVEVLDFGGRLYQWLLGVGDRDLEAGGLPREEVLEGYVEFLARVAPIHEGTWEGVAALAWFLAEQDEARGLQEIAEAARSWGESEPRLYVEWLRLLVAKTRWPQAWNVGADVCRLLGERVAEGNDGDVRRIGALAELLTECGADMEHILVRKNVVEAELAAHAQDLREWLGPAGMERFLSAPTQVEWRKRLERLGRAQRDGIKALEATQRELRAQVVTRDAALHATAGQRAREVARKLDTMRRRFDSGSLSESEFLEEQAKTLLWLRGAVEAGRREEVIHWLEDRLSAKVNTSPVYQGLLMALETEGVVGEWWGTWATAGVGATVEGLFREKLLEPGGIVSSGRKVDLRTVCIAVGKLAKRWDRDDEVGDLARWVETTYQDPEGFRRKLEDGTWTVALEWLKEHRNPAAHGLRMFGRVCQIFCVNGR